ncbi:TRZ/ATZ family hydrolase [Leeia sp. TBRC 13508]|uniref:5-methylthioadenosine/S-adenosylhomocysteine deaminase n=1 Tax=Leeia speluncae TaxID=2884804 RepID=A0ABS8D4L0_9NEIS|nr:TRZ/ATZ family hydrolase [Leeia speluncae]MCB6183128.1 TRZ/ATZ family hydrolase [Leeia speluncae]
MLPHQIDTLISARWVVTVDHHNNVLNDHSVAISQGKIVAILPTADAQKAFEAKEHIQLPGHALMPGLINLHTHSAMNLLRGFADDLALMTWLNDHIWPAEKKHVGEQFVYDGTLLAAAESLKGGVTTLNDMYFFPAPTAQAMIDAQIRAAVSVNVIEFPTQYAVDADDYLKKGLEAYNKFGDHPLLQFTMAPHAPYTISDNTFKRMLSLAEELDMQIHCHIHETRAEIEGSLKEHGVRPLERLAGLGLLNPRLIAVHMVHLTEDEMAQLAANGVHIAHNPSSNMKLASGICPVPALHDFGINVGIGTDGAASNNRIDMFTDMRTAALLAKVGTENPEVVPASKALEMATICGAKALGRDHEIGSIEVGKLADITAVDLSDLVCQPCFDPTSQLVYVAGREHVTNVWVNGNRVVANRELTTVDEKELLAKAQSWHDKLKA